MKAFLIWSFLCKSVEKDKLTEISNKTVVTVISLVKSFLSEKEIFLIWKKFLLNISQCLPGLDFENSAINYNVPFLEKFALRVGKLIV